MIGKTDRSIVPSASSSAGARCRSGTSGVRVVHLGASRTSWMGGAGVGGCRGYRAIHPRGHYVPCLPPARLLVRGPSHRARHRGRRDRHPVREVVGGAMDDGEWTERGWRRGTRAFWDVKVEWRSRAGKPPFGNLEGNGVAREDAPYGTDRRDPWGDRSPRGLACTCPPKRRAQRTEASSAVRWGVARTLTIYSEIGQIALRHVSARQSSGPSMTSSERGTHPVGTPDELDSPRPRDRGDAARRRSRPMPTIRRRVRIAARRR